MDRSTSFAGLTALSLAAALSLAPRSALAAPADNPCAVMTAAQVPGVTISAADAIQPAPVWTSPVTGPGMGSAKVRVPFCRVTGVIEKEIRFELWLPPPQRWNGRFLGAGNGGEAGFINYVILDRGVERGFASASTDTGHRLSDPHWALGRPDRIENYAFRAHHLLAVNSKALIKLYYRHAPKWSYFLGCSGGGMQGMNEVQRYPGDYNGVVAGASGYSMVPLSTRFLLGPLLAERDPAGALTKVEWDRVAHAAVEACDALDGVKDGVINDPRKCRFDPASTPGLTAAQGRQARLVLGPMTTAGGELLYPGLSPGAGFVSEPVQRDIAGRFFGEWLYQDPTWRPENFKLERDYEAAEAQMSGLRFDNPDLTPFARVGGKLLTYIGWSDPIVPAAANISYYDRVSHDLGPAQTASFFRLFLVPGMGHCSGGAGATSFGQAFEPDPPVEDDHHDILTAAMAWVEQGTAPDALIASRAEKGQVTMTRPLCAYPQVAKYAGGDTADQRSFQCVAPQPN